jgi:hypothetical protein
LHQDDLIPQGHTGQISKEERKKRKKERMKERKERRKKECILELEEF